MHSVVLGADPEDAGSLCGTVWHQSCHCCKVEPDLHATACRTYLVAPHGLRLRMLWPQVTKFRGQGSESDYQVSGLFDRDFAFNQLANHEPVLKAISRRRQARKMA